MNSLVTSLKKIIREVRNPLLRIPLDVFFLIYKIVNSIPINCPSFSSGSLGKDDVKIARKMLKDVETWDRVDIIESFESDFKKWNKSKYAFTFNSGRVALSAIIYALDLKPGDEVVIPGYTCVVVPNAFKFAGVKVSYVDIELETFGIDIANLEKKISTNTKAVLVQHLYGIVCRDYEKILSLCIKHDLKVIEDCAHAAGVKYKGENIGNRGDAAFYSSEKSKPFTTITGGIAVTNKSRVAKRLLDYTSKLEFPNNDMTRRQLKNIIYNYYTHRHPQKWFFKEIAYSKYWKDLIISTSLEENKGLMPKNYALKMSPPIAKIGINQLKKLDEINRQRRVNAKQWDIWCEKNGYQKPTIIKNSEPIYLRYPVLVEPEKKKNLAWAYAETKVCPGVWFVSNAHPSKLNVTDCPNADKAVAQCINFPTN